MNVSSARWSSKCRCGAVVSASPLSPMYAMNCPRFTCTPVAMPGANRQLAGLVAVVGPGGVVVDVDVPVLPPVGTREDEHVSGVLARVGARERDRSVVRCELVVELLAHQVVAGMLANAAEVVEKRDRFANGEREGFVLGVIGREIGMRTRCRGRDQCNRRKRDDKNSLHQSG